MPKSKEVPQNEIANLLSKKAMVVVAHADGRRLEAGLQEKAEARTTFGTKKG